MTVIAGILIGALWGGWLAARRKGSRLDIAQYATGYAIALGLAALILSLILDRLI